MACLGACSIAPVVKIGDEVHGNVKAKDLERLLRQSGKQPPARRDAAAAAKATSRRLRLRPRAPSAEQEQARAAALQGHADGLHRHGLRGREGLQHPRPPRRAAARERGSRRTSWWCPPAATASAPPARSSSCSPRARSTRWSRKATCRRSSTRTSKGGRPVERLLHTDPVSGVVNPTMDDIAFFTKQQLIALRNKGLIDPENIDHYIARGGYEALSQAPCANAAGDEIIQEMIRSGLRGRGGGGFPAGVKWESGRKAAAGAAGRDLRGLQRRRGRPGRLHGPQHHRDRPAHRHRGHADRRLRGGRAPRASSTSARSTRWRSSGCSKALAQARAYGLLGREGPRTRLQLRHPGAPRRRRLRLRRVDAP